MTIGYVLKGFPVHSETFISSEIYRVEQVGVPLRLFVVKPPDPREHHPVVDRIRAEPEYLPPTGRLSETSRLRWLAANLPGFLPASGRVLRRRPGAVLAAIRWALAESMLTRRSFLAWPRVSYVRDLLLALALADRVLRAPDVRHLHAHFAHDTTTITWLAARMTGLTFSFTAHAKDIYAHRMNPRGLLRRKLRAATFVVTCTDANRRHLEAVGGGTPVQLLYHGPNDDFLRFDDADLDEQIPSAQGKFRLLGVGRLVRKKGFDVFVEACGSLDRSGLDFSAAIAGEDDDVGEGGSVGEQLRRQIGTLRLAERVQLLGRTGQRELYAHYRTADVCCLPCRVLDNGDRDGIPNVLLEAMSCGLPVVSTPVSGIPELIDDGVNGLLVPPDDPEALASAVRKLHDDPALARRLAEAGRQTVRRKFDGAASARRLAELFEGVVG